MFCLSKYDFKIQLLVLLWNKPLFQIGVFSSNFHFAKYSISNWTIVPRITRLSHWVDKIPPYINMV